MKNAHFQDAAWFAEFEQVAYAIDFVILNMLPELAFPDGMAALVEHEQRTATGTIT